MTEQHVSCPQCGGGNLYLGIPEVEGRPVLCYDCNEVSFIERVVSTVSGLLGLSAHF
jgi:hypothetical protein